MSRRPGTARTTGVLTAAICLLLVGVQAWTVAARERDARALAETGAAVVLDVRASSPQRLLQAVRAADPGAGYAMAALQLPGTNDANPTLAVDGTRVEAVAGFAGRGPEDVRAALRPRLVAPLVLLPGAVRVEADVTSVRSPSPLVLSATLETPATEDAPAAWYEADLGALSTAERVYEGRVPAGCSSGCRLVGFAVSHPGADITSGRASLRLTSLAAGPAGAVRPLDAALGRRDAWRAGVEDAGGAKADLTPEEGPAGGALGLDVVAPGGFPARAVHGDSPSPVPAVVTQQTQVTEGLVDVTGADGVQARVGAVRSAPFVPQLGRRGAMVDLELALRGVPTAQGGNEQVWLSRDDPAAERALVAALVDGGVQVTGRSSAAQLADRLSGEGAVLALLLFLACGAVALLVAVGAVLVAAVVGSRQRTSEVAALRAVGVPQRILRRALLVENVAGAVVAVVCAVVSAVVVAFVVLPVLPLADAASTVLEARPTPDLRTFVVSVAAVAVLLAALAVGLATTQLRSGTAERIREGAR